MQVGGLSTDNEKNVSNLRFCLAEKMLFVYLLPFHLLKEITEYENSTMNYEILSVSFKYVTLGRSMCPSQFDDQAIIRYLKD